jgi:flavin reductase (DIM6/NTAB) family NADH-FMN oxidoreductase RutF
MLIVTTSANGDRAGCLVGFATQCCMDPVRFMVWISEQNRTFRVAQGAATLAIHFLGQEQRELAELFGANTGDEMDKFSRCRWHGGPGGLPILDDCPRWVVGDVLDTTDTGDHVGFIVHPTTAAAGEWRGQLGFQDLEPGHPA